MSKYKTPFPSDLQTSKALQARTSKYRLPFKKDEPSEDIQLTLNNISQNNISLISEVKLPKLAASTDLGKQSNGRKYRNNLSIHEEINMSVKSDKEEIDPMKIEILNESHDPIIEHFQMKETRKSKHQQERPKLSFHSIQRRRFLSSASKYADEDDINEDYTERSDEQSTSPNKDNNKVQQKALPTIGQGKIYKFAKEDSDEDLKVWETLTRDIEKFQQRKDKMQQYKQRIKMKSKHSKSTSKGQSIKENSIEYIQQELKKAYREKEISHKRSKSTIEKPSLYQGFKQTDSNRKVEAIETEAKVIKASMSLIDKLKEIISFKGEKSSKKKLKMPLEFYLNSYEQIKLINPFFRKLSQMQGCILLNIGKLTIIQAGKNVYSEGDISKSIYIIIYGKILLSNKYKTLKKFALTGETLCEEQLFQNQKTYIERLKEHSKPNMHKYQAKTLNKSCLLRIHLHKYYKMYCELSRLGYKQQFTLIDNLFRINFINKQTNLHQNQRDRIQTEVPHQRESLKYGPFFH